MGQGSLSGAVKCGTRQATVLTPAVRTSQESFPQLPTVVYWIRQVLGVLFGVAWGIIPLQGTTGIVGYALGLWHDCACVIAEFHG